MLLIITVSQLVKVAGRANVVLRLKVANVTTLMANANVNPESKEELVTSAWQAIGIMDLMVVHVSSYDIHSGSHNIFHARIFE